MTRDRRDDDVARARHAVRSAGVTYGPRESHRSPADVWHDFSNRYGWRAYALPALVVLTVVALMTTNHVPGRGKGGSAAGKPPVTSSTPPVASSSITLKDDAPNGHVNQTVLRAAQLPDGAAYTTEGDGTFHILPGSSKVVGTGQLYRYSIEIENGVKGIDVSQYENLVVQTLADSRSWSGHGVSLQRVDSGQIDFHISLTSTMTVRHLCGYTVHVETSCYAPVEHRVVFNVARWVRGATAYVGDLNAYRIYMINHEDGHALGHQHAHECLPGGLAPAMMQQTFGLRSAVNGRLCEANPWPYPPGAKGAPGAEQPDTAKNDEYGLGDGG